MSLKTSAAVLVTGSPVHAADLAALLHAEDLRVLPFDSSTAALRGLRSSDPPALIVICFPAPSLDGWRLCRQLRSPRHAAIAKVPILVISDGAADEDSRALAYGLGADAFLNWPHESHLFAAHVRTLLASQRPRPLCSVLIVEPAVEPGNELLSAFRAAGSTLIMLPQRRLQVKPRPAPATMSPCSLPTFPLPCMTPCAPRSPIAASWPSTNPSIRQRSSSCAPAPGGRPPCRFSMT